MPSFTTSQIVRAGITKGLIKQFALAWGVLDSTVRDWRRGAKHNPLDGAEKYIRKIHRGDQSNPGNPGNARLAASHFVEVVDELDAEAGLREARDGEGICSTLRRQVKESSEVVELLVACAVDGYDAEEIRAALTEIAEARAALDALEGCLRAELARLEQSDLAAHGAATTSGLGSASSRSLARSSVMVEEGSVR
jgi:hypothetical protein